MAIYHFSGTAISRSQGRSAVACAAYRSGERLVDERYQITHDYTRKKDVVHTQVLLPKDAHPWMGNRERLWNAVEAGEKRKDAQLSREFNFALPKELTLSQNIELATAFVQEQFVSKGMVADLCIHGDKSEAGELLYHAHVMLTMRAITQDGFGQKVRAWNAKELLLGWREAWGLTANHHLALNGHEVQIDHRTLEAQGIPLEPQYKIGPTASRAKMARCEDHQRIARENGEKLLAHPDIALKALTQQQSTFTHQDIARFVNRHTVNAEQFEQVYEVIKSQEGVVRLGLDEQGRERFTTREMLALETEMLSRAQSLSREDGHGVSDNARMLALTSRDLSTEQTEAFQYLIEPQNLKCVVGYAGSGKSYLLGAAREAWEEAGYRVHGVTLAGIAAQTLEGSSGIESRTLASRCYYWNRGEEKLGSRDILVVDEAGMLGSRQMARLLAEAYQGRAKVVLIGDPQQLQAIEAGSPFRAIYEQVSGVELTEIRRQRVPWQQEATRELAKREVEKALSRYEAYHHVHRFETQANAKQGLIELWNDVRLANPEQSQIILAYTRVDVQDLNERARELRKTQGELGIEQAVQTARGERLFASQDRVYFLQNDRILGVMNGTLGTIEAIKGDRLFVRLDVAQGAEGRKAKGLVISFDLNHYNHIDHGYAATVHKGQGVTVDRSYVLSSRYFDSHAIYVGLSRHRESVDVFWSKEEFPHEMALVQTLGRDRTKDVTLDYVTEGVFGRQRGIEVIERLPEREIIRIDRTLSDVLPHDNVIKRDINYSLNPTKWLVRQKTQDLSDFKKRFEAENPTRAKELREVIRPAHEKRALEIENTFLRLEKQLERDPSSKTLIEQQLKQEAKTVFKELDVMSYLKGHNEGLAQKIEQWAKPPTKSLEKEMALEIDRGGIGF